MALSRDRVTRRIQDGSNFPSNPFPSSFDTREEEPVDVFTPRVVKAKEPVKSPVGNKINPASLYSDPNLGTNPRPKKAKEPVIASSRVVTPKPTSIQPINTGGMLTSNPKPTAPAPYADPAPVVKTKTAPAPSKSITPQPTVTPAVVNPASLYSDPNLGTGNNPDVVTPASLYSDPNLGTGGTVGAKEPKLSPTRTTDSLFADYITPATTPPAPAGTPQPAPDTPLSRLQAQIDAANNFAWGAARQYSSADEGLANYANEYKAMVAQVAEHSVLNNAQYYRNAGLQADGRQALNPQARTAASDRILDYLNKNNIPLSKEVDGKTVYLTLGDKGLQGASENVYRSETGLDDVDGEWSSFGPVGTYSTQYIPPLDSWEEALNNPILGLAANFFPYGNLVLTAAKGASGQTLHAGDYLKAAVSGMKSSGMIKAPSTVDGVYDAGHGLTIGNLSLSYGETIAVATAASGGNPLQVAVEAYGGEFLTNVLKDSDFATTLSNLGIQQDDFVSGIHKAASKLAGGASLEDALKSGFVAYVKEGGSLGGGADGVLDWLGDALQPIGDIIESVAGGAIDVLQQVGGILGDVVDSAGDVIEPIVSAVGDVVEPIVDTIIETGSDINEVIVRPVIDILQEGGSTVDDVIIQPVIAAVEEVASVIGDAGSVVDDAVFQPIIAAVEEVASVIGDAGSEFDDAILQPIKDAVEAVGGFVDDELLQPLKDLLSGMFDGLNFNLGSLGAGVGGALLAGGGGGGASGSLLDSDPFKFNTKIGLSDYGPLLEAQTTDIEDLFSTPFKSEFA